MVNLFEEYPAQNSGVNLSKPEIAIWKNKVKNVKIHILKAINPNIPNSVFILWFRLTIFCILRRGNII